jgi:tRNA (guanine-N7-)-methyltransferase
MNGSQAASLVRNAPRYVIGGLAREEAREPQFAPQPSIDWTSAFGREAKLIVEVGTGAGETLTAAAATRPEINFVGFEVFERALGSAMILLEDADLDNVRLLHGDALSGLEFLFEPDSISEVWTFFPDPWPKSRHAKRRLVSSEFATLVASRLVSGGLWRLATDWDGYVEQIAEVLTPNPAFELVDTERFSLRPLTKFEGRGVAAGRTIHDFCYRRVETNA